MARTYKLPEVKKNIKDQGYSYVCLIDDSGRTIVPFNKASETKGAMGKFAEIEKRFNVLEDGVYYVQCKNSFNKKITPDSYPVLKGNATLDENRPAPLAVQAPAIADGKVMSYQDALKLTQENARLQAELNAVKKELTDLEKDYKDLEADYDEDTKETALAEPTGAQNWLQTTLPTLIPIADRFASIWEKSIDLQEKRLSNGNGKASTKGKVNLPKPGTPQFEQYLDQMEALDDAAFQKECNYLIKYAPDIYEVVYAEFNQPEGEGEEEEPK